MSASAPVWAPLLGEGEAGEAQSALADIAYALLAERPEGPSLAGGGAGVAAFLAYYSAVYDAPEAEERGAYLLEKACDQIAESRGQPGLFSGLSGVAWAVEHLAGEEAEGRDEGDEGENGTGDAPGDPNAGVDRALAELLAAETWRGPYDLIEGLCGIAVYAFERLPRPGAKAIVERVVAHLDALSEPAEGGRTWHTAYELLPETQRELAPRGYYNLGVAHGVPGVLGVLARAHYYGIESRRAGELLEGGMAWLWSQKLAGDGPHFPAWIAPDQAAKPTRVAWCYGDAGVAGALFSAARYAGEPGWETRALDLARSAARLPADKTGVRDAGLCHGALGLAHTYARLSRGSGDAELESAARFWLDRGLAMRQRDQGVAGFAPSAPSGGVPAPSAAGLLEGAAGIGLALLAAASDVEPDWDRALLLEIPS